MIASMGKNGNTTTLDVATGLMVDEESFFKFSTEFVILLSTNSDCPRSLEKRFFSHCMFNNIFGNTFFSYQTFAGSSSEDR
jgi:hypothetical protein